MVLFYFVYLTIRLIKQSPFIVCTVFNAHLFKKVKVAESARLKTFFRAFCFVSYTICLIGFVTFHAPRYDFELSHSPAGIQACACTYKHKIASRKTLVKLCYKRSENKTILYVSVLGTSNSLEKKSG